MIDLLAYSSVDRDTEITYVRKERDWLERAQAQGRNLESGRLLPMLPPGVAAGNGHAGNGHAPGALTSGDGHAGHSHGPGAHGH
jgi:hypothetical protein